jgi:hypothetical protein
MAYACGTHLSNSLPLGIRQHRPAQLSNRDEFPPLHEMPPGGLLFGRLLLEELVELSDFLGIVPVALRIHCSTSSGRKSASGFEAIVLALC